MEALFLCRLLSLPVTTRLLPQHTWRPGGLCCHWPVMAAGVGLVSDARCAGLNRVLLTFLYFYFFTYLIRDSFLICIPGLRTVFES